MKKIKKYLEGLPHVSLKSLRDSKKKIKAISEKFGIEESDFSSEIEAALKKSIPGQIPAGMDMKKAEKAQRVLEDEFFNEPEDDK